MNAARQIDVARELVEAVNELEKTTALHATLLENIATLGFKMSERLLGLARQLSSTDRDCSELSRRMSPTRGTS